MNWRILQSGLLVLLAGTLCATASTTGQRFLWEEANARMQIAETVDDFQQAAQLYRQIIAAGVRNGAVYYNLGTALLQARQPAAAIAAFQRAEQYLGADPDLRHNLRIALAQQTGQSAAPWPWYRSVFFWHFDQPAARRAMTAAMAILIFYVSLSLWRWTSQRSIAAVLLTISGCVILLTVSSLAVAWQQDRQLPATVAPSQPVPAENGGVSS